MNRIPLLNPKNVAENSISSIPNLCHALDISPAELLEAIGLPPDEKYTKKFIPKKDGSNRLVHNPHKKLRIIQRRINKRILSNSDIVVWPDHLFGSIPNQENQEEDEYHLIPKDYIACAQVHCESKSILNIDIKDFFDNIHQNRVKEIFSKFFHFDNSVSEALAEVCCYEGRVVQGALTSSYLACLCLFDTEGNLVSRLNRKGLRYTRLVDDITISSKISDYNFDYAKRLVEDLLAENDLPVNSSKTKCQYLSSTPLTVHGLRVAFKEPRLPSDEVRRIRSAVKNIESLAKESSYRTSHAYRKDFNRCMGRVNKLSRVKHSQHEALLNRLRKVLPLPSKKDIERTTKIIERLELDYALKKNTYWFTKRYYLAHERLNILARSFPNATNILRSRLRPLFSTFD